MEPAQHSKCKCTPNAGHVTLWLCKCLMSKWRVMCIDHFRGCATLTSRTNSLFVPGYIVLERTGLRGYNHKSHFRRFSNGLKSSSTLMSCHCWNEISQRHRVAPQLLLAVQTAMTEERKVGDLHRSGSIIEQTFCNSMLLLPPGLTPLWSVGSIPDEKLTCVDFRTHPIHKRNG